MAFGDNMKTPEKKTDGTGNGGGKFKAFINPFLDMKGDRTIRLRGSEIAFLRYWVEVNTTAPFKGRSLIASRDQYVPRDHPLRLVYDAVGKDNDGYNFPTRRFWVNVLDRTLVKKLPDGAVVYQVVGKNGRLEFPKLYKEGTDYEVNLESIKAEPHNTIKILEGGKQLMDTLVALNMRVPNNVTMEQAKIDEIDITIISSGTGLQTNRSVIPGIDHRVLSDELRALPLYDIDRMARPLPYDAVQRLMGEDFTGGIRLRGEDWDAVMESLGIVRGEYPMIAAPDAEPEEEAPF